MAAVMFETDRLGEPVRLPTPYGEFALTCFANGDAEPHLAATLGLNTAPAGVRPLVRIHSECLTGDVFGSRRCDCGPQLDESMRRIAARGVGVVVYLRQEGRGIGLRAKLRAYALQEGGLDTVDANTALGFDVDARSYQPAIEILRGLHVGACDLLTNNPDKVRALADAGIDVMREPIAVGRHVENERYLASKRERLGICAVARDPGICAVARDPGICAVARDPGICAVARDPGICAVARDPGICAVARDPGICAVARDPGICAVARDPGICAVARDPGICAVARDPGICAVARDPGICAVARVRGICAVVRHVGISG